MVVRVGAMRPGRLRGVFSFQPYADKQGKKSCIQGKARTENHINTETQWKRLAF